MKATFFKGFALLTLAGTLLVSCGNEKGSKGNSSYLNSNYLTGNGQQALQLAQNWYNSNVEGTRYLGYNVTITRTRYDYSSNNNQNCVEKKFLGIPYTYCTYSSGSSSQNQGTVVSTQSNVNLYASMNTVAVNAKGNVELNNMFNGSAGNLVSAQATGSVIRLDFARADGTMRSYVIDTSYHSLLNPVEIVDQAYTGSSRTVTSASGM